MHIISKHGTLEPYIRPNPKTNDIDSCTIHHSLVLFTQLLHLMNGGITASLELAAAAVDLERCLELGKRICILHRQD